MNEYEENMNIHSNMEGISSSTGMHTSYMMGDGEHHLMNGETVPGQMYFSDGSAYLHDQSSNFGSRSPFHELGSYSGSPFGQQNAHHHMPEDYFQLSGMSPMMHSSLHSDRLPSMDSSSVYTTLHSPGSSNLQQPSSTGSPTTTTCSGMQSPSGGMANAFDRADYASGLNNSANMENEPSVGSGGVSSRHICTICEDRASGKHYGAFSCEGCKGFFKRTVRKELQYACREDKDCIIDKRQRNRCQYCRYMKCLTVGMKPEAVQDERQRSKGDADSECTSSVSSDMPIERILQAELSTDMSPMVGAGMNQFEMRKYQARLMVNWARQIPYFSDLSLNDQVILLKIGWNELLIVGMSHRSLSLKNGLLHNGVLVPRESAHEAGVGVVFDRVLTELVGKMRDMRVDRTELGCLKVIVLFNPDSKGITNAEQIEALREKVYTALEEYSKTQYPEEPGRFAKLLLRLPALRSIGLKFLENPFLLGLLTEQPGVDDIVDLLRSGHQITL